MKDKKMKASVDKKQKKLRKEGKKFEIEFSQNNQNTNDDVNMDIESKENLIEEEKIGKYWEKNVIYSPSYTHGSIDIVNKDSLLSNIGDKLVFLNSESFQSGSKSISFEGESIITFISIYKTSLVVCSLDNSLIRVYDTETNKTTKIIKLNKIIAKKFILDSTQQYLAVIMSNNTIAVYETVNFNQICNFQASNIFLSDIIFNPIKKSFILYSAADDGLIKAWDVMLGK